MGDVVLDVVGAQVRRFKPYVAPGRQRRGIGRRLLDEATAAAIAWPSDAIRLDAYDATAGAGAFYAKCGFREVGRVTYRGTPLVYLELLL